MIVECGHCGAPLDVAEGKNVFSCRYCGTKNERARTRTVAELTPADFQPPKKWTPPTSFPADSGVALTYKRSGLPLLLGGILFASCVVLPAAIGIGSCLESGSGFFDTEPARLQRLTKLAASPGALAEELGGKASDTSVWVELHSERYKGVSFSFDSSNLTRPESFAFVPRVSDQGCDPAIAQRIAATLRGGLNEAGNWTWENVSIGCEPKSGVVYARARAEKNPLAAKQLDAIWKVALHAVFGYDLAPSAEEQRDLLGSGYPFASLATFPIDTPIDSATEVVRKRFPGAAIDDSGQLLAAIPVDHPLFKAVKLRWMNARNATLYGADFWPLEPKAFPAHHDALSACLARSFGDPRVTDEDFMKKTKASTFPMRSATLYLGSSDLSLSFTGGEPADPQVFRKLVEALEGCR